MQAATTQKKPNQHDREPSTTSRAAAAFDAWIYRDGHKKRRCARAIAELTELIRAIPNQKNGGTPVSSLSSFGSRVLGPPSAFGHEEDALVLCGELEASLSDAQHPAAQLLAYETDRLADAVVGGGAPLDPMRQARRLSSIASEFPEIIETSTQEGFAFYALDPRSYARAVRALRLQRDRRVVVVGIRTIGATLSAVVAAELRRIGVFATRITERPTGPPFNRTLALNPLSLRSLEQAKSNGSSVVVVDEGPGLSGSTILAAAEAIAKIGIPEKRIVLLVGHTFEVRDLLAPNAEERFARFRVLTPYPSAEMQGERLRSGISLSAGAWRAFVFDNEDAWPGVFAEAERRKVLVDSGAPDGARLIKFEGLGSSGRAARARARALFNAGFCAEPRDEGNGYLSYRWDGVPSFAGTAARSRRVLDRLATYCAERPLLCPPLELAAPQDLRPMVAKNLRSILPTTTTLAPLDVKLSTERIAIVDGRMAPHEWLTTSDGMLLKTDAIAHGDDHFFPGPTDIAWDLAGTIVEWRLPEDATEYFLETYRRASGDDPRERLDAWIVAYSAFRAAISRLAFEHTTTDNRHEKRRLARDVARYKKTIEEVTLRQRQHQS